MQTEFAAIPTGHEWTALEMDRWNAGGNLRFAAALHAAGITDLAGYAGPSVPAVPPQAAHEAATCLPVSPVVASLEAVAGAALRYDLSNGPFYLLLKSEIGPCPALSGAFGITSPSLDLAFKPLLGARWRGRGACVALNDDLLIASHATADVETATHITLLHEMAHIAASGVSFDNLPPGSAEELFAQFQLAIPLPEVTAVHDVFVEHNEMFWRSVCHCICRAAGAGMQLQTDAYDFMFSSYGLQTGAETYCRLLKDEIDLLSGYPINRILREIAVPPEFSELFNSDVAAAKHRDPIHPDQERIPA